MNKAITHIERGRWIKGKGETNQWETGEGELGIPGFSKNREPIIIVNLTR